MKTNVGGVDKFIRVVLGIGLLGLFFLLEGNARWFGLIGFVPLVTAFVGYCPLYGLLRWSTCPAEGTHA